VLLPDAEAMARAYHDSIVFVSALVTRQRKS